MALNHHHNLLTSSPFCCNHPPSAGWNFDFTLLLYIQRTPVVNSLAVTRLTATQGNSSCFLSIAWQPILAAWHCLAAESSNHKTVAARQRLTLLYTVYSLWDTRTRIVLEFGRKSSSSLRQRRGCCGDVLLGKWDFVVSAWLARLRRIIISIPYCGNKYFKQGKLVLKLRMKI